MRVGLIADDITGATDLAAAVTDRGVSTVLVIGVPDGPPSADADAVVVALKTRTIAVGEARERVRAAAQWLLANGATRLYNKYCSTFDSTSVGNIGPIADELLAVLAAAGKPADWTVHCPSYPANARTVYQGHLFVGAMLLNESGMQNHPLTPMTDANLVRVLQPQTPKPVGLAPLGRQEVGAALATAVAGGAVHVIADAITDTDIDALAAACADRTLLAGGAPFGAAVAAASGGGRRTELQRIAVPAGPGAVLVGSASRATLEQVARFEQKQPVLRFTPAQAADERYVERLSAQAVAALGAAPVLVAVDSSPDAVAAAQAALGVQAAAELVERTLAQIAADLTAAGAGRLIVAGGETSGAVAQRLQLLQLAIGPTICPGVPWMISDRPRLAVAFKSGNFGGVDFFTDAFDILAGYSE